VIAPSRGAAYRRFYLYSALSVAVIAVAIAGAVLLRFAMESLGFGHPQSAADVSRSVSLAAALLAVAVPVGGAHLWLILRSLRVLAERSAGVRHQYLNLWVAFALLVMLFAGQAAVSALAQQDSDVTIQTSILLVAAAVAASAAAWILRTPPESSGPRIRSAVIVMLVAMGLAAVTAATAAGAAGFLFGYPYRNPVFGSPFDPTIFEQQALRSGIVSSGVGLTAWAIGFTWQRHWPESRDRLGYALLAYGLGTIALLVGGAFAISGAVRFLRDPLQVDAATTAWPALAAGALLVVVHASLLIRDRGRNGHPAITTTRLLLAFPALVGLGLIVGGIGLAWHAILERDLVPATHIVDDVTVAAALAILGAFAYGPSWLAFRARATAESAVRRFYLFTVVCLALIAGLVSAVLVAYNAITAVASVGEGDAARTAATWVEPTLVLAFVFATHLALLLRDQRQTRATEGAPADPLLALLEDVRAGRVSTERAAATIRGPLA
jgi:hypothetical protein